MNVQRVHLFDVELTQPITDPHALDDYGSAHALVRVDGAPVGFVNVELRAGACISAGC